jgi:hypothetical protein
MEWANKLRDEYFKIEQERDELKARLAELEPKEDPDRWWPDNVEVAPIEVIAGHIERSGYDPGYSVRLGKLFAANDIKKVGEYVALVHFHKEVTVEIPVTVVAENAPVEEVKEEVAAPAVEEAPVEEAPVQEEEAPAAE